MKKELKKCLNGIIQSEVIYSKAGGSLGQVILMELSNKDDLLYAFWIGCDWRIEYKNKVIATSSDNVKTVKGLVRRSVKMLEGKIIDSIKLTPFYDLCVKFTDGFCLRIFCIFSCDFQFDTNWCVAIPDQDLIYEITNYFKIKKGKYNS
jgi:hypothetical protein